MYVIDKHKMGSTCMKKAEHACNVIRDDSIIGHWIEEIIFTPDIES
jgi:hypothetical protein